VMGVSICFCLSSGVSLLIAEMNRDWLHTLPHQENREGYKEMVQKVNDLCRKFVLPQPSPTTLVQVKHCISFMFTLTHFGFLFSNWQAEETSLN
jgi:hypothetical protein